MKQDPLIERFLDNLWAERGLSDNSLQSYRHDLLHLQNRLAVQGQALKVATRENLLTVLAAEIQQGKKSSLSVTISVCLPSVLSLAGT